MSARRSELALAGHGAQPKEAACRPLLDDELEKVRAVVSSTRDRLLVEALFNGGFRVRGVCSLTLGSARGALATGWLRLRAQGTKGGRAGHAVPLRPTLRAALAANVAELEALGISDAREPLFRSRKKGGFLQAAQAYRIVRSAFERAGLAGLDVPGLLGTHCGRKYFARKTYDAYFAQTGDGYAALEATRIALGHSLLDTTRHYLALDRERVADAVLAW